MKQTKSIVLLAAIFGAVGCALRLWQRAAAYDESGLPIPMALPSMILVVFLVLGAVALIFLAMRLPKIQPPMGDPVPSPAANALLIACAALLLAGSVLGLLAFFDGYGSAANVAYFSDNGRAEAMKKFFLGALLPLALSLAALPTAVAVAYKAKTGGLVNSFAVLMPPVYCWIWLIEAYRQHTVHPIIWDYAFLLLAIIALLLGGYHRAGLAYGVGKPRLAALFSALAVMLTIIALPDRQGLATIASLAAMLLYTLGDLIVPATLPPEPASPAQSEPQEELPHE